MGKLQLKGNKLFLFKKQKGKCWLCDKNMPPFDVTYDHITPKSAGGSDHLRNLRVAHQRCNQRRGNGGLFSLTCLRLPRSSMVEQLPVKELVPGSSPGGAA